MADVKIVKFFELYKSSNNFYAEERQINSNRVEPTPQRVGAKVVKIELEFDSAMFDTPPIVVKIDMKDSTKQMAERDASIIIPVKHNLVDEFEA